MGPNAAAKEFIDPAILADPTVNPDQELVDKLEELLDLGPDVRDEYLKRWQTLRGGRLSARRDRPGRRRRVAGRSAAGARSRPAAAVLARCPASSGWSLFFVVPLAIIFVVSLGDATSSTGSSCDPLTLDNYRRALDPVFLPTLPQLAPLRGRTTILSPGSSATRSPTGSAATAAGTRRCC